jgi:hypothetical protein
MVNICNHGFAILVVVYADKLAAPARGVPASDGIQHCIDVGAGLVPARISAGNHKGCPYEEDIFVAN